MQGIRYRLRVRGIEVHRDFNFPLIYPGEPDVNGDSLGLPFWVRLVPRCIGGVSVHAWGVVAHGVPPICSGLKPKPSAAENDFCQAKLLKFGARD